MSTLKLPAVFTDHAVLQHSRSVPVWGWTQPGARVSVEFRGSQQTVVAGDDGKFFARISTQTPGGPFELVFHVDDEVHVVHDVLVGEVWLCSGQSNMEFPLRDSDGADHDIPQFRHNGIRLLPVPQTASSEPAGDVNARWFCCSPETIAAFSGVAAYFGRHLHEQLSVPVGLIQSAWGGTTAEAWTSREALLADADLAYLATSEGAAGPHEDPGISPAASTWMNADLEVRDWQEMLAPQPWERTGLNIDGAVWFRKVVQIPERWAGRALLLSLDVVDDFDIAYFAGREVGQNRPGNAQLVELSKALQHPRRTREDLVRRPLPCGYLISGETAG